jgi:putative glycosyltransferase
MEQGMIGGPDTLSPETLTAVDARSPAPELSIVTTLYNSAPYLADFYRRVSAAASQVARTYEIVLVNDGSPDDSLERALALHRSDDRVVVVDLSRNFGHHRAIITGLSHARGDRVFLLDADLEDPPELLISFAATQARTGSDMVLGVQQARRGRGMTDVTGGLFWRVFNFLSDEYVTPNQVMARLMTRRYVDSLVAHRDRSVFLAGLCALTGFEQTLMPVTRTYKGSTSYSLRRKLTLLEHSVTSFSARPLIAVFYVGSAIMLLSLLAAAYLVVQHVFFGELLVGWPSAMVSIWLLGGATMFCVGLVGVYLSRVFTEVKDRPYTVVRAVHRQDGLGRQTDHIRAGEQLTRPGTR